MTSKSSFIYKEHGRDTAMSMHLKSCSHLMRIQGDHTKKKTASQDQEEFPSQTACAQVLAT